MNACIMVNKGTSSSSWQKKEVDLFGTKTDLPLVTGFVHSFFQWLLADRETECGCVTS